MFTLGLDIRATEPGFKAHYGRGTGRYATELVSHLLRMTSDESECRVVPLRAADMQGAPWEQRMLDFLPFGKQTAETQLFLPRRLGRLNVDWLHFVAHGDATARCPIPYIVTVLDLIPLRFAELYRAKKPGWRFQLARDLEKQSIQNAKGVIAISEATKKDLVELLGVPAEKVFVTHLGVSEQFAPRPPSPRDWHAEAGETKLRLGIDANRPMLLYAGGIDPRKNVHMLLRVFAEVLQHRFVSRPQLVLAGAYEDDDQFPALKQEIARLGLDSDVRLLGFVKEEDLPPLFRAAHLKVFPSLFEGFGLPVLEAMASGVPVVAGANSSIPEVAGNAAVLLDTSDERSWVEAVVSILLNETRQGQLSSAGKVQARRFSWERTAARTLDAYEYFWMLQARAPVAVKRAVEKTPESAPVKIRPEAEAASSGTPAANDEPISN